MKQRQRAHFINSLSGFKSANLIGTQSNAGITNVSIVSSVIARYPKSISEFDQTSLSAEYTDFLAPYVEQSRIRMGVEFREKKDIELNGTVMIIGEIVEVLVESKLIQEDGKVDIVAAQTVSVSGLDEYHIATSLGRLAYAKPR